VIRRLARTDLTKRAVDVLAYFDRPGTSNGPTEAINGRLEHHRGSALGFRNLTNAAAFNSDASSYLSSNSPDLFPGWEQGYKQVWDDINALAADCGQPGAGPYSGG
jgi:hypothetical protein